MTTVKMLRTVHHIEFGTLKTGETVEVSDHFAEWLIYSNRAKKPAEKKVKKDEPN
jgi:hypothetical protein